MTAKPIQVLQSVAAPGRTIKYIDQVVRYAPESTRFHYFSWRRALFGRYDVLHLHWPEFLMRSGKTWLRPLQRLLVRGLIVRLKLTRTPVVRTQHNREPHERGSEREDRLLSRLDALTTDRVFLSAAVEGKGLAGRPHVILHGDYREELGGYPASSAVRGRFVFFGRIEPYKSVPELLDVFERAAEPGDHLRVVGRPTESVRDSVEQRVRQWRRTDATADLRLEHVTDAEMVTEITSSEAVVLPYSEMNNSGVVLVALSLGRPVIVPASATNQSIADEVGEGWVLQYEGPFTDEAFRSAKVKLRAERDARPDLAARDWVTVATSYAQVFGKAQASARIPQPRRVYVNVGGQRDNIGDSLLRRAYLDALRGEGRELHAYAGWDPGYTSGLGTRSSDVVYESPREWLFGAAWSLLARPGTSLAFNTGEVVGTREEQRKGAWQPALARLAALRRRPVLLVGVSVRPGSSPDRTWLRMLSRTADLVSWRDDWSRSQFGVGSVNPDWAFLLGASAAELAEKSQRPHIAVAMRGDRPLPDDSWFDAVRAVAAERRLSVTVVVQVKRDAARAQELARRLEAEILQWPEGSDHAEQERRVRDVYRRSSGVVSDRIHALIVGYTEGAVPLGFSTDSPEKVVRSLSPATGVPFFGRSDDRVNVWTTALDERVQLLEDLAGARGKLHELTAQIAQIIDRR